MFWKQQAEESTSISNLLNKEDVTLKELLDDPYALQELKCNNQRFIDYLKRPDVLTEITKLCLNEPIEVPDEDAVKRYKFKSYHDIGELFPPSLRTYFPKWSGQIKYCHLASEILSTDSEQVTSALSENQASFDCLSDFISSKQTINPLLGSSFAKILSLLAQRFPARTLNFMQNNVEFLDNCLFHLETYAVADALYRICACIESDEEALKIRSWLCERDFVGKLISKFTTECSEDAHVNASFVMNELIRYLRDLVYSKDDKTLDPLLEQLQSRTHLDELLAKIFALPRSNSVLVSGCSVFLTLLQTLPLSVNLIDVNYSKPFEHVHLPEVPWSPDPDGVVISCVNARLQDFLHLILSKEAKTEALLLPMGPMEQPFGPGRLACLKVITQLVTLNSLESHQRMCDSNVFTVLFDCFFAYPYNNFLHCCIYQFLYFVLNVNLMSNDAKIPSPLLKQVFKDGQIYKLLLEKCNVNLKEIRRRSTVFGHLMKMAENLDQATLSGCNSELIKEYLKDLPQELIGSWSQFIDDVLQPYLKMNEPDNTGISSGSHLETLREDFPLAQSSSHKLNQLFVEYQTQPMTEQFCEPTGFPPDTFTSDHQEPINDAISKTLDISIKLDGQNKLEPPGESSFDLLCNQKTSALDSDEDDWPGGEREITFNSSSLMTNQLNDSKNKSFSNKPRLSSSSEDDDDENETHTKMDADPASWANFDSQFRQTVAANTNNVNVEKSTKMETDDNNWAAFDSSTKSSSTANDNWANFDQPASGGGGVNWTNNIGDIVPASQGIAAATLSSGDWPSQFNTLMSNATMTDQKTSSGQSSDRSQQYVVKSEQTLPSK